MKQIQQIVLLHGWACDSRIWQSMIPFFERYAKTVALDLNDYIESTLDIESDKMSHIDDSVRVVVNDIAKQLSEGTLIIGWSLGGMLAAQLAVHHSEKIVGLITLASNPVFVSTDSWQEAMPSETFDAFFSLFKKNTQQALKRFTLLEVHGDEYSKDQLKYLKTTAVDSDPILLEKGLALLIGINNIEEMNKVACPALFCFGENDALVPISTVERMRSTIKANAKIVCLDNSGHLLHHPIEKLIRVLEPFLSSFTGSATHQDQTPNKGLEL